MPDGQRSSSKGDKGLTAPKDENFLYASFDENEGTDEELTAIAKQVSRVNFNTFIHSDRFQGVRLMDGKDVDMKGSLKLGGDLVVLSVVLNKKQKENDEVALAIDRLRNNGVNCVFFTMNDMRNGTSKSSTTAESEGSNSFRRSTSNRHSQSPVSVIPQQLTSSCLDAPSHLDLGPAPTSNSGSFNSLNPEVNGDRFEIQGTDASSTQSQRPSKTSSNIPNSSEDRISLRRRGSGPAPVSLKTSKPQALPVQEIAESPVQHDHLLPPLLSPAEPEPVSAQMTLPRKRRRRRKRGAYSVNPARGKAKKQKPEPHSSVLAKKKRMNGVLEDCPPVIESSVVLQQANLQDKIEPTEEASDLPPILVRADLVPLPPYKRRNRKSKEERIADVVRASVAICGATPEVVLGQRRKCTTKPPLTLTVKQLKRLTVPAQPVKPAAPDTSAITDLENEVLKVSIPLSHVKVQTKKTNENTENLVNGDGIISSSGITQPALSTEVSAANSALQNSKKPKFAVRKPTRSHSLEEKRQTLPKSNGFSRAYSPDIMARFARVRNHNIGKKKIFKRRYPSPDIISSNSDRSSKITSTQTQSVQLPRISDAEPVVPQPVQRSASLNFDLFHQLDLSPLECLERETKSTLERVLTAVVSSVENESDPALQYVQLFDGQSKDDSKARVAEESTDQKQEVVVPGPVMDWNEDSLPEFPFPDSMKLRRSSFFSLITGNVRTNFEKYLDGCLSASMKSHKRRRRAKNGFLLHHGDNCPEDPEAPYKLHLSTQVLIKLNKRRSKVGPKEDRGKTLLSYLKLVPKRPVRASKPAPKVEEKAPEEVEQPLLSGEWTIDRKYVCGICGATENGFWDMATHKGEEHPGVIVTHIELPIHQEPPQTLIRESPAVKPALALAPAAPSQLSCSKCSATFSSVTDLHGHIFTCAGNASWLEEKVVKKPKGRRRKRGFKRRFSATPKKPRKSDVPSTPKRRSSELFKCEFCVREFKTEGWLRNHMTTHSLPVSIPLDKLPLASLPVRACLRKLKY